MKRLLITVLTILLLVVVIDLQRDCRGTARTRSLPSIDLPHGPHAVRVYDLRQADAVVVSLGSDGSIWACGEQVTLSALPALLDRYAAKRQRQNYDVTIRAGSMVELSSVIQLTRIVVKSRFSPIRVLYAATTAGGEGVFPYGIALKDGNKFFPWYKIIFSEPDRRFNELVNELKIDSGLPGFCQLTVRVSGDKYRTLGKELTRAQLLELFGDLKLQYRVVAVVFLFKGDDSYLQLINSFDVCLEGRIASYVYALSDGELSP